MPQAPFSISTARAARRERTERLTYASIALTAIFAVPVVLLSHNQGFTPADIARYALCAFCVLASAVSLVLMKLGRRRAAACFTMTSFWIGTTAYVFYTGFGLHSGAVFLYLPGILYASLLLGMVPAAVQTALTLAVLGTLVWAEDSGRIGGIQAFIANTTNFNFALGAGIACVASMVVAIVYRRTMDNTMKLLDASRSELLAAHAKVSDLNAALEQRVAERTRELEETIGDLESFNYTVAHDLRTPLRAMHGYASALLESCGDKVDTGERHMMERIKAAALRLDALQSALLELGRIGVRPFQRKRVDLSAAADNAIRKLKQSSAAAKTRFRVAAGLGAEGDPKLASALLEHLMANAVKFSAGGDAPCVEFSRTQTARGPAFYVRDNGVGFDPAFGKNMFLPFHQLHVAGEYQGIGIGLACAKRIVERHRGLLWAENGVEDGATFYFTLSPHCELAPNDPALQLSA